MMIQVWAQEEDYDIMIQLWALNEEITIEVRAQEEDHDIMNQVSALMTVKDDANFGWIVTVCCNFVQHFPDHEREEKQKHTTKKK